MVAWGRCQGPLAVGPCCSGFALPQGIEPSAADRPCCCLQCMARGLHQRQRSSVCVTPPLPKVRQSFCRYCGIFSRCRECNVVKCRLQCPLLAHKPWLMLLALKLGHLRPTPNPLPLWTYLDLVGRIILTLLLLSSESQPHSLPSSEHHLKPIRGAMMATSSEFRAMSSHMLLYRLSQLANGAPLLSNCGGGAVTTTASSRTTEASAGQAEVFGRAPPFLNGSIGASLTPMPYALRHSSLGTSHLLRHTLAA